MKKTSFLMTFMSSLYILYGQNQEVFKSTYDTISLTYPIYHIYKNDTACVNLRTAFKNLYYSSDSLRTAKINTEKIENDNTVEKKRIAELYQNEKHQFHMQPLDIASRPVKYLHFIENETKSKLQEPLTPFSRPEVKSDSILSSMKYPNLKAPQSILNEAEKAMSFYPALANTAIEFKFNDMVRKNFMQAQPTYKSIFRNRKNRSYIILISKEFKVENKIFTIKEIPSDVLTGWLGHELGHVMDYRSRSTINMIFFGLKYLYSHAHIQEVERAADDYAVRHGMGEYILKTKEFILNHTSLSEKYKQHMRKFYLSPEEILELINRYGETGEKPSQDELAPN